MKKALALVVLVLSFIVVLSNAALAGSVKGYYRSNGTYVNGYERSSPNRTVTDNYSFKGNTNPYTGATGSNYYRNSPSSPYYGTSSSRNGFGSSNDED